MSPFAAELIGTMLLIILGDGVVANVVLQQSKGQNSGWIVITTGWALAVTFAVYCVGSISGAHLNPAVTIAVASIGPAVRRPASNLITEIIGTFMLVLGVLAILTPANLVPDSGFDVGFGPFLVGIIVWAIGLSLGGPTGYAINPARDLGPRIAHALLPIAGKGSSDWSYAWVPIVGPIIGGVIAAFFYIMLWP